MKWKPLSKEVYEVLIAWGEGKWKKVNPDEMMEYLTINEFEYLINLYRELFPKPVEHYYKNLEVKDMQEFLRKNTGLSLELLYINVEQAIKETGEKADAGITLINQIGNFPLLMQIINHYERNN